MSTMKVIKNDDGTYELHMPVINGSHYGIIVNASRQDLEQIAEAINSQFADELNSELSGFLDDDSCEGCKI